MPVKVQMTMEELYALPPVVAYEVAGRAFGMARHKSARMLAAGEFPVKVRPLGVRKVVYKSELFTALGIPLSELATATTHGEAPADDTRLTA